MKKSVLLLLILGMSLTVMSKEKIVNIVKSGGGLFGYDYVSQKTSILNGGTDREIWIIDLECYNPGMAKCKYNKNGYEISGASLTDFEESILGQLVELSEAHVLEGVTNGVISRKYFNSNEETIKSFSVSWSHIDSVTKISVRISDSYSLDEMVQ